MQLQRLRMCEEKASEVNARIRIPPSASSRSSIKFINVTPLKVPNGRKEAAFAASSYSIRIWCCFIQWRQNAWAKNLFFFFLIRDQMFCDWKKWLQLQNMTTGALSAIKISCWDKHVHSNTYICIYVFLILHIIHTYIRIYLLYIRYFKEIINIR